MAVAPKLTIYCLELDTWYTPVMTQANRYTVDAVLPANHTDKPITYTFELYTNNKPSGMFAYVVVMPDDTEYANVGDFFTGPQVLDKGGGVSVLIVEFEATVGTFTAAALKTDYYTRIQNYLNGVKTPMRYVRIQGDYYKMIYATPDGERTEQLVNLHGQLLFWREAQMVSVGTQPSPWPVITYRYVERTEFEHAWSTMRKLDGTEIIIPLMKFGPGPISNPNSDNTKFFIWNDGQSTFLRHTTSTGNVTELRAQDDGKWYYNHLELGAGGSGGGGPDVIPATDADIDKLF